MDRIGSCGDIMKDIKDSTILVTGSTDGIGKLTAKGLAARGATVLLHGRDPQKGVAVQRELQGAVRGGKFQYYNADLSSFAEVANLAKMVSDDHSRLDVLVNNAGIGEGKQGQQIREMSRDGFELRFAVNYLAPFLLTHILIPLLRRSAPSAIVNVASMSQRQIDFYDLMLERHYDPQAAYGQSKLALVMMTLDLAEELKDDGITVNAVHPGNLLNTKMVREAFGHGWGDPQEGADAVINIVTSPAMEGVTGRFFFQGYDITAHPQADDPHARRMLRELSLGFTRAFLQRP